MRARTTMLSLCGFGISYVLKLQDKHNASIFSICRELTKANPSAKLLKILYPSAIQTLKFTEMKSKTLELNKIKHR